MQIAKKCQQAVRLFVMLSLLVLPFSWLAPAADAAAQSSQIDAMLVVDASNSMKTSDPDKISNEAMKMFIDMLSISGDKVGVISYTDQIQREKALMDIASEEDKEDLKEFIDQLDRGAYTDIAVGMNEAVKVLQKGADPSHEPMIVLLADGNNDFNKSSGRSEAQSDQELAQAVQQAKDLGIPVYTIGLNADGKLNKQKLAEISDNTGGKSFSTDTADDLPQILSEIFASHLQLNIVNVQSITGNGAYQEVTINVPSSNVKEANISIMSNQAVDVKLADPAGNAVTIPSSDVLYSKSKSYSLVKLLTPEEGDWKLQVKGADKDQIDINLVFNYDLELELDHINSKVKKGDSLTVTSYLVSGGQKLQDQEQMKGMSAKLLVKDLDTGSTEEIALSNTGEQFEGTYKVPDEHDYELVVRAEEKSFYRETTPVQVSAKAGSSAAPPAGAVDEEGENPSRVLPILIGVIALIVLLAAGYVILMAVKKRNQGFVGQIVIEIRDENTGDKTYPQYKKLSAFKGKFNLHQLLQLAPELKDTEKIIFTPGKNDRILLKNNSESPIEKSGRMADASKGLELKSGDRVTVPLQNTDKTILIEYLV